MKAAIYNPYLDSLGGGERYTMSFAKVLVDLGYNVDVEWSDLVIRQRLERNFAIDLSGINFVNNIHKGENYDLCFWVSDGSIPLLKSRKNILHFQMPFSDVGGKSLMNKMKLFRINHVVCNSKFTKRFIDKEFGIDSIVIYPPIDVARFRSHKKENIILYVGRFSQLTQAKNQHVLVDSFKTFYDSGQKSWSLILAGGSGVGTGDYVDKLKESSKNYPIQIIENPSLKVLTELYGKSKIFWSASGYGVDESKNPEKVEHFGMTVVEAMSAKCVPIVYNGGGHREIINDHLNGFVWESINELISATQELVEVPKLVSQVAKQGFIDSRKYSFESISQAIINIL